MHILRGAGEIQMLLLSLKGSKIRYAIFSERTTATAKYMFAFVGSCQQSDGGFEGRGGRIPTNANAHTCTHTHTHTHLLSLSLSLSLSLYLYIAILPSFLVIFISASISLSVCVSLSVTANSLTHCRSTINRRDNERTG